MSCIFPVCTMTDQIAFCVLWPQNFKLNGVHLLLLIFILLETRTDYIIDHGILKIDRNTPCFTLSFHRWFYAGLENINDFLSASHHHFMAVRAKGCWPQVISLLSLPKCCAVPGLLVCLVPGCFYCAARVENSWTREGCGALWTVGGVKPYEL